jgi:hypothetical protein
LTLFSPLAEIPGAYRSRGSLGVRRLWAAVLQDGINVLLGKTPVLQSDRKATELWFSDAEHSDEVPAFDGVCIAVGLEPEAVRRMVAASLAERPTSRRTHWLSHTSKYGKF